MENMTRQRRRGWAWATLFVILGVIYISDGLRGSAEDGYRLLMGAGFLLAAAQAFFSPVNFASPRLKGSKTTAIDWIGFGGMLLLAAGLVVRWL